MSQNTPPSFVFARCPYCQKNESAEIFSADVAAANTIVQLKMAMHRAECGDKLKGSKEPFAGSAGPAAGDEAD